jgi:hypothetical protein
MKRTLVALLAPPAAVINYGCATQTAAPIGVFWLASLASIGYGIAGGTLGSLLGAGGLVTAGVLLWLIATAWARLVIGAVESDLLHRADSTHDHQVEPCIDESDPFSQLRSNS